MIATWKWLLSCLLIDYCSTRSPVETSIFVKVLSISDSFLKYLAIQSLMGISTFSHLHLYWLLLSYIKILPRNSILSGFRPLTKHANNSLQRLLCIIVVHNVLISNNKRSLDPHLIFADLGIYFSVFLFFFVFYTWGFCKEAKEACFLSSRRDAILVDYLRSN
jgi:hypothetical protein